MRGGGPCPNLFVTFSRGAFLVNKGAYFFQIIGINLNFKQFLGGIYMVCYIVHMLVLVINCLSNLELQRRRNVVKVVKIGCGGGGG